MGADQGAGRLVLRLAAQAVLACLGSMVLWSVLPLVLGWHPTVVMSGSMKPSIQPGDVVVTRSVPVEQLRIHQVVLVPDPDHPGRLRLHRLQKIRSDGRLVLRGDANGSSDSSLVRASDVMGVGVLRVPLIGSPARAARTGQWPRLVAMLFVLGVLSVLARSRPGAKADDRQPRPPKNPGGTPSTRATGSSPPRPARERIMCRLAVVSVVTALVTLSAPAGFAAFGVTAANPSNQFTAAASFYPYKDAVLTDTPVLYWRLGEASGTTAANTASSGPTGTYYSSPTLAQPSALSSEIVNKSISTTTGGFVTATTTTTAPTQFTIEAWIKTTTTAGGRIFGFGNGGTTTLSTTPDRQLYLSPTGKAVAGLRNANLVKTVATSPLSYNDGQWHHLAATYNGTILRLYVDGAQVASTTTTATATFTGYWRAAQENLTGWPTAPSGNSYAGGLDELAVYATALSATRISAHYTAATS
jgi:signal peptidase I